LSCWLSLFHSVSAFCNAGFSLFSDSFQTYRGDVYVNTVLILFGGLGFLVHLEVRQSLYKLVRGLRIQISLHTKLVLSMTLGLIIVSLGLFLIMEWNHALQGLPLSEKLISALFQVIQPQNGWIQHDGSQHAQLGVDLSAYHLDVYWSFLRINRRGCQNQYRGCDLGVFALQAGCP